MTCLEHWKFTENQENARKINRAEAWRLLGQLKIIENPLNSYQISIWASLGLSKPLKSLPRESGLPKPENITKIAENAQKISFEMVLMYFGPERRKWKF